MINKHTDKANMNKYNKSVPKSVKLVSLRTFVREFNFPNPDWNTLPSGFPDLPKTGLSCEEGHLLEAITLAWLTTNKDGRVKLYINTVKSFFLIVIIFIIGTFGIQILKGSGPSVQAVNAATLNINEVVQSTMSAILRK